MTEIPLAPLVAVLMELFRNRSKSIEASGSMAISGEWSATWQITSPPNYSLKEGEDLRRIDDFVSLKVKKGRVTGSAKNTFYNKYDIIGIDSIYAVTLLYQGYGSKAGQPGVILLTKDQARDELSGFWWQYLDKGSVLAGTVIMKRAD